jgi:hypothetical protein
VGTGKIVERPPLDQKGARVVMDRENRGASLHRASVTFQCSRCGAVFSNDSELRAHRVEHGIVNTPEQRSAAGGKPRVTAIPPELSARWNIRASGKAALLESPELPSNGTAWARSQDVLVGDVSREGTGKVSSSVAHRWRVVMTALALAADLVLLALTAANQSGPLRFCAGLVFVLFVPGWVITRFTRLDWPAAELSIAVGASLAISTVVAQGMLMTHSWHPAIAQVSLALVLVPLLVVSLIRLSKARERIGSSSGRKR